MYPLLFNHASAFPQFTAAAMAYAYFFCAFACHFCSGIRGSNCRPFFHALLVCMSASRTISLGYNYASCLVGGFMLNVSQHTLRYYCCVSTLYNGIIYLEVNYFDIVYLLSSFRLVTKSIPIIRMQSIAGSEGIDFM